MKTHQEMMKRKMKIANVPSQWQAKYGKKNSRHKKYEQDESLSNWIASIQEKADAEVSGSDTCFEPSFMTDLLPTDHDAMAVISQMNRLLSDGIPSSPDNFNRKVFDESFHLDGGEDFDKSFHLDGGDGIDFENDSDSYFREPSVDDEPVVESMEIHCGKAFSCDNMASLFRRSHDDKILKKCFDCLLTHATDIKGLRCRAFSVWKSIAHHDKEVKDRIIIRSRQRSKVRCLRRILSSWRKMYHEKCASVQRATESHIWRKKKQGFDSWLRLARRQKWCRAEAKDQRERLKLARRIEKADKFHRTKLKQSSCARWLAFARKSESEHVAKLIKEKTGQADIRYRTCNAVIEEDTPMKTPKAKATATCITPERKVPTLIQDETCITPKRKLPVLFQDEDDVKCNENENHQPNCVRNKPSCSLKQVPELIQDQDNVKCNDKENMQPNRVRSKLSCSLKPQQPKYLRNPPTPKLISDMRKRKSEREKRREVLRHRYEQKAIEKKKRLEEEKFRRQEAEMKVQREFAQRKAAEEHKKKMAAARWKQACRLAVLHYRMSLQKRMLLQWKLIFRVMEFNNRKAHIAWSDTTYEKCWKSWKLFTGEEQKKRREGLLKRQQLADDLNDRRLLAKSFASLEVYCHHTHSLLNQAQQWDLALRQRSVLTKWSKVTIKARKERSVKEINASKNGNRLLLMKAIHSWQDGVKTLREEHEINMMIEAKWEDVNKWLAYC